MINQHGNPESLRVLIAEFSLAMAVTYGWWRLGLPMRGISRKKDGPMSRQETLIIVIAFLAIFLVLALVDAAQNRQLGRPIF